MKSTVILKFLILLRLILSNSLAYKYKIIPSEKLIFACPGEENNSPDVVFNYNYKTEITEDDVLMASGMAEWIFQDKIKEPVEAVVKIYKKIRGQWMETPFVIYRKDICESLFNPKEFWYKYSKQAVSKKCPPDYGTTYSFPKQKAEIELDIPSRNQEGEYKAIFRFKTSTIHVCFEMFGNVIRTN